MDYPYHAGLLGLLDLTEEERRKTIAWANATPIPHSSDRLDCDNRVVSWAEYGKTSAFGWEIDHAMPTALGGSNEYGNLRARHWLGNRSAGGLLGALLTDERPRGLLGALLK